MAKPGVWFADLTHTAQGINLATFPLGSSYVLSYAKQELGSDFDFRLFRFPEQLEEALREQTPAILCFSTFCWNLELAYRFASMAKSRDATITTVFGGANFPTSQDEKMQFLRDRPAIDFFVELEGELGFVELVHNLARHGFNAADLREEGKRILNTSYLYGHQIVSGVLERIKDINVIPSPYLTGTLDEFFAFPLVPMIETTRGCPFSCTFCADGIEIKNKIYRYDSERTKEELHYIARKVRNIDELIITDLNFAMYIYDLPTAEAIAEIQRTYDYPKIIAATAGKNKPKRTIEIASIIKGWTVGASIQSSDPEVLSAVKRSNISSSAYQELMVFGNSQDNSKTVSDIILGLPADTKTKHFESLRYAMDNSINSLIMFQSMLLIGTEMASVATRKQYGLITKFRALPGSVGVYDIFGERQAVSEFQEIIVGSDNLPIEDYVDCRVMNLIIETFYNNAKFEEVFALVRSVGASPFDCLLYLKDHPELYSKRARYIFDDFVSETSDDLFDTLEQAADFVLSPDNIEKYVEGKLGTNELLLHSAMLFDEFEEICDLMFAAVKETLLEQTLLTAEVEAYLNELKHFMVLRKKDPFTDYEAVNSSTFNYDFEAIRDDEYRVDLDSIRRLETPIKFEFFHDEQQKRHISNQARVYANTPIGLGRLMKRSNLKMVFRNFAKADVSEDNHQPPIQTPGC